MNERRINKRVLSYWKDLQEINGAIPPEASVSPDELQDIWGNCFIINTKNGKYSFQGDNIIALSGGQSLIGKDIYNNLICPDNSNISSIVKEVVNTKSPISQESQIMNKYGVPVKFRRCFVPLSDSEGNICYVLGGIRWKAS